MPDWPTEAQESESTTLAEVQAIAEQREMEIRGVMAEKEFLEESLADVQQALQEQSWMSMALQAEEEFSPEGRRRAAALTRILVLQNPLIKRGVSIRTGYIWGGGVQVTGRDDTVNEVIARFEEDNKSSFSSSQAREESEKTCATDGNVFRALPTSPLTGRVRVRTIDPAEIAEIIPNPEDRDEPWFYLRRYTVKEAGIRYAGITKSSSWKTKTVLYPALGFKPTARVAEIDGIPVQWDTPIQHIAVNRIDGWLFGIGDAYAAIPWARAYKEFLEDWARISKSLSRFTWRLVSKTSRTQKKAAEEYRAAANVPLPNGQTSRAGATASMAGSELEAIPKTGATIDADSGKPLAGMVAASLSVSIVALLCDPGTTGARAVAETLDTPTRNEFNLRRELWADKDRELYDYVIDMAVKAPKGPLKGTVKIDEYGREVVTLRGDVDRTIDIDWPSLEDEDVKARIDAIVAADGTDKVPELTIARLLLIALDVEDVDEVLEQMKDEDGNFVAPSTNAGDVAVKRFRDGEDPVGTL